MLPNRLVFRRGLILLADGVALWFLGVLIAAYSAESVLPWGSWTEFRLTAMEYTIGWLESPTLALSPGLAYVGIFLIVVAPPAYWIFIPNVLHRFQTIQRILLLGMAEPADELLNERRRL